MTNDRVDQRDAGVSALRQFMKLPADDAEAVIERRMLRRMDLREAVRR